MRNSRAKAKAKPAPTTDSGSDAAVQHAQHGDASDSDFEVAAGHARRSRAGAPGQAGRSSPKRQPAVRRTSRKPTASKRQQAVESDMEASDASGMEEEGGDHAQSFPMASDASVMADDTGDNREGSGSAAVIQMSSPAAGDSDVVPPAAALVPPVAAHVPPAAASVPPAAAPVAATPNIGSMIAAACEEEDDYD